MYREILVYTSSGGPAAQMSEFAVDFAARLRARLTALIVEVEEIDVSRLDQAITDAEKLSAVESIVRQKTEIHARADKAAALFDGAARQARVQNTTMRKRLEPVEIADSVSCRARLYDCALLPSVEKIHGTDVCILEQVVLGSGRPVIMVPTKAHAACAFDRVAVAWDGSAPSTRAVHDALPVLKAAAAVVVLTIAEEKPMESFPTGDELVRHLRTHDINAQYVEARYDGGSVGEQLMELALEHRMEMMVMGAYGHPRIKELVFGGATRGVLKKPRLPVLLSH